MLATSTEKPSTALHINTAEAPTPSDMFWTLRHSTGTIWSPGCRGKRAPWWTGVTASLVLRFQQTQFKHPRAQPSFLTSRMTCCSSSCSTALWISSTEGTRGTFSSLCSSSSGLGSASSSKLSTGCPVPALTGAAGVKATEARYNFLLWLLAFLPVGPEHTEEESEFPWENIDSVPSAGRVSSPSSPSPKPSSDFRNDCSRISSET